MTHCYYKSGDYVMYYLKKMKLLVVTFCSLLNFNAIAQIVEIEINNINELRNYHDTIHPEKSAYFIDFDETIVRSVGDFDKTAYRFLSSPDLMRTYRDISKEVLPADYQCNSYLFENQHKLFVTKELMEGHLTKEIIQELIDQSAYVSILSGLAVDFSKKIFLSSHWGVHKETCTLKLPYNAANDKAKRALELIMEKFDSSHPIENIVLVDNSYEFSLEKFKENIIKYINAAIKENSNNVWLNDVNVILVHYKYFGNELTVKKLKAEYDDFQEKVAQSIRPNLTHSTPNLLIHMSKEEEPLSVTSFLRRKLFKIESRESYLSTPIIADDYFGDKERSLATGYISDDTDYYSGDDIDLDLLKVPGVSNIKLRCSQEEIPVIDLHSSGEEIV